jgi:heptosyltransferase-2
MGRLDNKPPLIVRLPNWVGDVIMALPAIQLLRDHHIPLILMGRPWIFDLLKGTGLDLIQWPSSNSDARTVLKKNPVKNMLLFTNSFSSALIPRMASKRTMGYGQDCRSLLLSHCLTKPTTTHETEVFLHLAQQAIKQWYDPHASFSDLPAIPSLTLFEEERQHARHLLNDYQVSERFIVLCPFAQGLTKEKKSKKWPLWQELAIKLQAFNPIICPGPNEINEARTYFPQVQLIENTKLNTYAGILSLADLVITNDSGPMHIAAALNRPTFALFGTTDPNRCAPLKANVLGGLGAWPDLYRVFNAIEPVLQ